MKSTRNIIIVIFLLMASVSSFAQKADSTSIKLQGKLFGTWEVQSATRGKTAVKYSSKDVTVPNTIRFTLDAKYVMLWDSHKLDSGSYNTNEGASAIYLQSVSDKDHLQEWKVEMKSKDALTMTGRKGSKSEGVRYECLREKGKL